MNESNVQLGGSLPDIVQVQDIWVVDEFHDDDFTLDP